jgi:hypothetical protein
MFNPFCFGKPMLWHNEDVTPHYKPLVAWSGRVTAEVTDKFSQREDADRIALTNIKIFLSVRPLPRDMDRWIAYWYDCTCVNVSIPQFYDIATSGHPDLKDCKPPEFIASEQAISCADLLDWEDIKNDTLGGAHSFSVPYIPTYQRFNWDRSVNVPKDHREYCKHTLKSDICCHATNVYALYSQMYHGRIKASSSQEAGERALTGKPGVYCFEKGTKEEAKKTWTYAYGSELGTPGMLYFFVWEVLCSTENLITSSAGQARDQ